MPISTARQFFDELVAGGTPVIESLVTEKKHETEWLDFKQCTGLKDDKTTANWSEAVCGFGNNQGGVLIWGIDARKGADMVDAASDLTPVDNPAALRSRLIELLRTAVEPPLPGVEVRDFIQSGTAGPGYVVCFIPESQTKPHRAVNVKNMPYLIRIADNFHNPGPSLLRTMFFPKSSPVLSIEVSPAWTSSEFSMSNPPRDIEVRFEVDIRNTGFVTAKDVYVVAAPKLLTTTIEAPYRVEKNVESFTTGLALPRPVHPSSVARVCMMRYRAQVATIIGHETPFRPALDVFEVDFDVFAADMMPLRLRAQLGDRMIDFKHRVKAFLRPE